MLPEIRELIANEDYETLNEALNRWQPVDIADQIHNLEDDEDIATFKCLRSELAVETFVHLAFAERKSLLKILPERELAAILIELAPDDRTTLLESLDGNKTESFLEPLTHENRLVTRSLLTYGEGTFGRLMTLEYVSFLLDWTDSEVLEHIRKAGRDSELLNALDVIDEDLNLIDDVRRRTLLLSNAETTISQLANQSDVALRVTDTQETAVEQFRKYDRSVLPVIDGRGRLLGVVTVDGVLDVAAEAATKDLQKFGGLEALNARYVETPILELVRKRGVRLVVLFLGEMLTASAMGFFEDEIKKAVVLALFVPLIISSGGNSGSQAATLIVRAMAMGEVRLTDWWMVMK